MKDHLIPKISSIKTTKYMFDALNTFLECKNTNRAISLKHQLQNIKMTKEDIIATFFMKIVEIRDKLGTIGEIILDKELVMITLNGLPNNLDPFIQSISRRSKFPEFDRLWADCTQDETRLAMRGAHSSHHDEIHALSYNERKRRGRGKGTKIFQRKRKLHQAHEHKEKDMSKF
jgi:hypothetical protein